MNQVINWALYIMPGHFDKCTIGIRFWHSPAVTAARSLGSFGLFHVEIVPIPICFVIIHNARSS